MVAQDNRTHVGHRQNIPKQAYSRNLLRDTDALRNVAGEPSAGSRVRLELHLEPERLQSREAREALTKLHPVLAREHAA